MNATLQTTARPTVAFKAAKTVSAKRTSVVVYAQRSEGLMAQIGKQAAVAAAALALTVAPNAEAAINKLSAYEKELSYEAELLSALKARTGKDEVLPRLSASPTGPVKSAETKAAAPLKLDGGFEKVKVETPAATPTPAPAVPAAVEPPKAAPVSSYTAAPVKATAPTASSSSSAAAPADNKTLIAVAGVAVVGIAALAAGNSSGEGESAAAPAAATAGAGASSDVPANVAEARAWIAAWKAKHGKN